VFELSHGRKRARLVTTTCEGSEMEAKERHTDGQSKKDGGRDERRSAFAVLIAGFVPLRFSGGAEGGGWILAHESASWACAPASGGVAVPFVVPFPD
jgi:hypothetical protein